MSKLADLTVYHVAGSRSLRVVWLLEELNIPYTRVDLDFKFGASGGEEYKKIHPLHKMPALKDADMVMFESIAIMQYILARYGEGRLAPAIDSPEYGPYLQWLHYGESSLAPPLVTLMLQRNFLPHEKRSANTEQFGEEQLHKQVQLLDRQLDGQDYILKSGFSAADISVGYCLLLIKIVKAKKLLTPRLQAYLARLSARDGWKAGSQNTK